MVRALSALVVLLLASPAHADDWLALYPECAFGPEARALGRMAMIYPRPGLPAVVAAGERLVTRVRVPSGLTPPPGIQRDRALRGWLAELVGQSIPLGDGGEHRYRTRVVDVRPDGQSTLVYRASIEVPIWVAPGTYGIRMSAPGGTVAVAGAVRVLSPGAEPRLSWLPADATPPPPLLAAFLEMLSMAPHDVVVAEDDALLGAIANAPLGAAVPALLAFSEDLPVALRVGSEVLSLGGCDDHHTSFALLLEGIASREGRRVRRFGEAISDMTPWPATGPSPPTISTEDERLTIRADSEVAAELSVRYADDGRGVRVMGAEVAFHPAVSIPMTGAVPTIALRLRLAPGVAVTLSRTEANAPPAVIRVVPEALQTGETVQISVDPDGLAFVGWRLEDDLTWAGSEIEHSYRPIGEQRVHAFVISEDGVGASLTATVQVKTREAHGCGGCTVPAEGSGPQSPAHWADLWLIAAVLLRLGIRRRNRPSARGC